MPRTIAVALLAVAMFALLSLASGATYLEALLPGGLPLGNVLAALGLCAAAGAGVVLSAPGTALRSVAVGSLLAAAAWLPASILLAGNLVLNFSGARGSVWSVLSLGVVAAVLCALVWALASRLSAMLGRVRSR